MRLIALSLLLLALTLRGAVITIDSLEPTQFDTNNVLVKSITVHTNEYPGIIRPALANYLTTMTNVNQYGTVSLPSKVTSLSLGTNYLDLTQQSSWLLNSPTNDATQVILSLSAGAYQGQEIELVSQNDSGSFTLPNLSEQYDVPGGLVIIGSDWIGTTNRGLHLKYSSPDIILFGIPTDPSVPGGGTTFTTGAGVTNIAGILSGAYRPGSKITFTTNSTGVTITTSAATVANPTATVGVTAVNGSALTSIRSDGAPAIDQTMSPTWTGQHIFQRNAPSASNPIVLKNLDTTAGTGQSVSLQTTMAENNATTLAASVLETSRTTDWTTNSTSYAKLKFYVTTAGSSREHLILNRSNVVVGYNVSVPLSATDGFLYAPSSAGAPVGIPTSYTGKVPMEFDSTNNKLYFYSGGSWQTLTSGGSPTNILWDSSSGNLFPSPVVDVVSITSQSADNATNVAFVVNTLNNWTGGSPQIWKVASTNVASVDWFGGFYSGIHARDFDQQGFPALVVFGDGGTHSSSTASLIVESVDDFSAITQDTFFQVTTLADDLVIGGYSQGSTVLLWNPTVASTGSSIGYLFNNSNTLTNGDSLVLLQHVGTNRFDFRPDGSALFLSDGGTVFGVYDTAPQLSLTNSLDADAVNTQRFPIGFSQTGHMWNTASNVSHSVTFMQNVIPVGGATTSARNSSMSWNAWTVQGNTVTQSAPFSFSAAGNGVFAGNIRTGDPTSGSGDWKLGKLITAGVSLDTTRYVEVAVDGVVYKLLIAP